MAFDWGGLAGGILGGLFGGGTNPYYAKASQALDLLLKSGKQFYPEYINAIRGAAGSINQYWNPAAVEAQYGQSRRYLDEGFKAAQGAANANAASRGFAGGNTSALTAKYGIGRADAQFNYDNQVRENAYNKNMGLLDLYGGVVKAGAQSASGYTGLAGMRDQTNAYDNKAWQDTLSSLGGMFGSVGRPKTQDTYGIGGGGFWGGVNNTQGYDTSGAGIGPPRGGYDLSRGVVRNPKFNYGRF